MSEEGFASHVDVLGRLTALRRYGAMGLLATTASLWAGRILVRLFMSEHHLAIDAEERATMVHNDLALQLKQQVEPKDLHLVLCAIFRPTADGIVKDDAAPDIWLGQPALEGRSKITARADPLLADLRRRAPGAEVGLLPRTRH